VILVTPDVVVEEFRQEVKPARAAGVPLTVYAAPSATTLELAHAFHAAPRAGDSAAAISHEAGVQAIDAGNADTSLAHPAYFAEPGSVLSDMYRLIMQQARAEQRPGLQASQVAAGRYWTLRK
jgi:esterase/lipase superfamily enzyme